MNRRITAKERGLIKGALRRVFSRSELRRDIIASTVVQGYQDVNRPRVKKWSLCAGCLTHKPTYTMQLDHKDPIIPTNTTLEDMSWDLVIDRIWCDENNLNPLCKDCHDVKTKAERKERTKNRRERKNK